MSEDRCPVCAELGHAGCVDAAIQRAERAERVAVRVARGKVEAWGVLPLVDIFVHGRLFTRMHADTSADIYRALVEACEGGDSNG